MQTVWKVATEPSEELMSAVYTIENVTPSKWLGGFAAKTGELTPRTADFLRIHGWEYNLAQWTVRFSGDRGIQSDCRAGLRLRLAYLKIVSEVREYVESRGRLREIEIPWTRSQFMINLLEGAGFIIVIKSGQIWIRGKRKTEAQQHYENVQYWEEEAERKQAEEDAE
jgi:hypothetical protein